MLCKIRFLRIISIMYKLDYCEVEILIKHIIQYLHKTKNNKNNVMVI